MTSMTDAQTDPDNGKALQTPASVRLSQQRPDEANSDRKRRGLVGGISIFILRLFSIFIDGQTPR